jgi:serine/threonine protein kinase
VYEFCNGGTLEDKIKMSKMINEVEAVSYFTQLMSAFSVLHDKKILHRDIKPTNILFHNGKLKLADFGFCK